MLILSIKRSSEEPYAYPLFLSTPKFIKIYGVDTNCELLLLYISYSKRGYFITSPPERVARYCPPPPPPVCPCLPPVTIRNIDFKFIQDIYMVVLWTSKYFCIEYSRMYGTLIFEGSNITN